MALRNWLLLRQLIQAIRTLAEQQNISQAPMTNIIMVQTDMMRLIRNFQQKLATQMTKDKAQHVVLPVTLAFDEWLLKHYFQKRLIVWPLLQTQLFQVNNGGQLFYTTLEQHLKQAEAQDVLQQNFLFEIYYFFLKEGFGGMYANAPKERVAYLQQLETRLG